MGQASTPVVGAPVLGLGDGAGAGVESDPHAPKKEQAPAARSRRRVLILQI
jgi:hypothetical protein